MDCLGGNQWHASSTNVETQKARDTGQSVSTLPSTRVLENLRKQKNDGCPVFVYHLCPKPTSLSSITFINDTNVNVFVSFPTVVHGKLFPTRRVKGVT